MRVYKKMISVFLALIFMTVGIPSAFADNATGVSSYASGNDSDATKNITEEVQVSAYNATGVSSIAEDGGKATVTVSNSVTVTATGQAEGLYAGATVSGTAVIKVDESVTAEGNNATGISGAAEVRGESTITVDQSVTVAGTEKAEGVKAEVHEDGKVTVTVHGSLEAKGNSASGISVLATEENSEAEITIDKQVTVDGQSGDVYGLNVSAASGSSVNISAGAVNAGAGPDSKSDPDQTEAMHIVTKDSGTEVTIRVSGDVVSGGDGIFVDDELGGDVDIIIDGTLSAEGIPVVTFGDTDHVSLAVWKIEEVDNGNGSADTGSSSAAGGSSAEQSSPEYAPYVYYILKSEQPKVGGSFELDGTGKKDDFDVARCDEKVSLLVTLAEGYQLTGAYNGDNDRVSLDKDENGNYFIKVPMGGGVYLSVDISEIHYHDLVRHDAKAPTCIEVGWAAYETCSQCDYSTYKELPVDPNAHKPAGPVKENVVAAQVGVAGSYDLVTYCALCGKEMSRETVKTPAQENPFTRFCKTLSQRIRKAPEKGTVEADATSWVGLQRDVFKALLERPDVTLKLTCRISGEVTELTIPAGFDLLSAMGDARMLTFEQIAQLLG